MLDKVMHQLCPVRIVTVDVNVAQVAHVRAGGNKGKHCAMFLQVMLAQLLNFRFY